MQYKYKLYIAGVNEIVKPFKHNIMLIASKENPVFRVISSGGYVPFEEVEAIVADSVMDVYVGGYQSAVNAAMDFIVDIHNEACYKGTFKVSVVMYDGTIDSDGAINKQVVYSISNNQAKRYGLIK